MVEIESDSGAVGVSGVQTRRTLTPLVLAVLTTLGAGSVSAAGCGSGNNSTAASSTASSRATADDRATANHTTAAPTPSAPKLPPTAATAASTDPEKLSVTGSFTGFSFAPKDTTAFERKFGVGTHFEITSYRIIFVEAPDACALAKSKDAPSGTALRLDIGRHGTAAPEPGAYPINDVSKLTPKERETTISSEARLEISPTTGASKHEYAKSGSITLSVVDKTNLAGSFDLVFESGSLKGKFDAGICFVQDDK